MYAAPSPARGRRSVIRVGTCKSVRARQAEPLALVPVPDNGRLFAEGIIDPFVVQRRRLCAAIPLIVLSNEARSDHPNRSGVADLPATDILQIVLVRRGSQLGDGVCPALHVDENGRDAL